MPIKLKNRNPVRLARQKNPFLLGDKITTREVCQYNKADIRLMCKEIGIVPERKKAFVPLIACR